MGLILQYNSCCIPTSQSRKNYAKAATPVCRRPKIKFKANCWAIKFQRGIIHHFEHNGFYYFASHTYGNHFYCHRFVLKAWCFFFFFFLVCCYRFDGVLLWFLLHYLRIVIWSDSMWIAGISIPLAEPPSTYWTEQNGNSVCWNCLSCWIVDGLCNGTDFQCIYCIDITYYCYKYKIHENSIYTYEHDITTLVNHTWKCMFTSPDIGRLELEI